MRHGLPAALCAGLTTVMTVVFCGTATADPPLVPQGQINAIILSSHDVGSIVGATLDRANTFAAPYRPADLGDKSACNVLLGLDTGTVSDDYETFKTASYNDGDDKGANISHIVTQNAAIYPDTDTPAKLFHDDLRSLNGCDTVHDNDDNSDWQIQSPRVSGNHALWTTTQLANGKTFGWRCSFDLRAVSNVFLQAEVCQYGNPIRTVALVADRMAAAATP